VKDPRNFKSMSLISVWVAEDIPLKQQEQEVNKGCLKASIRPIVCNSVFFYATRNGHLRYQLLSVAGIDHHVELFSASQVLRTLPGLTVLFKVENAIQGFLVRLEQVIVTFLTKVYCVFKLILGVSFKCIVTVFWTQVRSVLGNILDDYNSHECHTQCSCI